MQRREHLLLAVTILGLLISGYLSYAKLFNTATVCIGGSGSCELVQNSVYAYFLGIPVAYFGFLTYVGLLVLLLAKMGDWNQWGHLATMGYFALALFGTIFSAYLTYVELFILGDICQWCIASALVTVTIFVLSAFWLRQDLAQFE